MAPQPTRDSARTALTTAGVGAAALLLAAAAAAPAFADDHGNGHKDGSQGTTTHTDNGNHYGQAKDHSNNGQASSAKDNGKNKDGAGTTGHNPPGNNGTVKIHDDFGDTAHHNVAHVDCDFAVAFWGFDLNQKLDVSFAGQAPTGKDVPLTVTGAPTSITSPDDAGGGQDYDGELQFTADQLDLASLGDPQPKQGYHIRLTVNTYEPGGHKYKVFWLQPCAQPAVVAPTESAAQAPDTETNTAVPPAETGQSGQTSAGATVNSAEAPTQVLGRSISRGAPASAAAPAAASLPFTGAEIGGLAAAAAFALGGGTALTIAGRRRRSARSISSS